MSCIKNNYLRSLKIIFKVIILTSAVFILFISNVPVYCNLKIADVKNTDPAYSAIQSMLDQKIMKLTKGNFYPDSYIRRQEFAQILASLNSDLYTLQSPYNNTFKDVPKNSDYYKYIESEKYYIPEFKGYFKPQQYITKEDVATAIVKAMGYDTNEAIANGVEPEVGLDEIIQDADSVSFNLKTFVSIAVGNELMTIGKDNNFYPKQYITRKQLAQILQNAYTMGDYSKDDTRNQFEYSYVTGDSNFEKAQDLFDSNKFEEAIKYYDKSIALYPMNYLSYYDKGYILNYELHKYDEAKACFNKVISLRPSNAKAYYNKGYALMQSSSYKEALDCYNKAIQYDSTYAGAYYNKGTILSGYYGNEEEAIKCFDQAIKFRQNFSQAYNNKGMSYIHLKKYNEALTCFESSINSDNRNYIAIGNKGLAYYYLKRPDEALKCYDLAISINPKEMINYYNKGLVYKDAGKNKEAIDCFDKVITLDPTYISAYLSKGICLNNQGSYSEAIKVFDNIIKSYPSFNKIASTYLNKGIALYNSGKYQEALDNCNSAISIDPNYANAYNLKMKICLNLNNKDEYNKCVRALNKLAGKDIFVELE